MQSNSQIDDTKEQNLNNNSIITIQNNDDCMTAGELYNAFQGLQFDMKYLIMDIRMSKSNYIKSHIVSSLHLDCSKIRKNKGKTNKLDKITFKNLKLSKKLKAWDLKNKNIIIIYKENNSDLFAVLKAVFSKTQISQLKILKVSYTEFNKIYPFLCVASQSIKAVHESIPYLPQEMIHKKLYLGNKGLASKRNVIKRLNISHVVNVTKIVPFYFENDGVKYMRIPIKDTPNDNILPYFNQSNKFIDDAINNPDSVVLVHCQQGKSRSATIVIAYLIYKYKYEVEYAINYVKTRRYVVQPNDGFIKQLQDFAKTNNK